MKPLAEVESWNFQDIFISVISINCVFDFVHFPTSAIIGHILLPVKPSGWKLQDMIIQFIAGRKDQLSKP